MADVIPTKSSGSDVPMAKMIAEIANTPILLFLAILRRETIIHSADFIKMKEKKIKLKICNMIIN